MRETVAARRERARAVVAELGRAFPDARCALDFTTPFQLLLATVLSAQTTDARVNEVTPTLFARYPTPAALRAAERVDLEEILRPLGFFRTKARALVGIGEALDERYDGAVPATLEELVTLPGVGRKTANVVLGNAFDTPGITVDTHVGRVTRRLGLHRETDPVKAERALGALLPESDWTIASHRFIALGRAVCHARRPACSACPVATLCPRVGVTATPGTS